MLPDGTLIKNQAPKGRWHLDTRDQHVDWEGFDIHVLIPENRELLYTWDRDLGCLGSARLQRCGSAGFARVRSSGEVSRRRLGLSSRR